MLIHPSIKQKNCQELLLLLFFESTYVEKYKKMIEY